MAKIYGLDGHLSEKSRKYQWFKPLVLAQSDSSAMPFTRTNDDHI